MKSKNSFNKQAEKYDTSDYSKYRRECYPFVLNAINNIPFKIIIDRSACQKITFLSYWMCRGDHWSPANLVQQRVSKESIFTEKRARASNAHPYKSFWQPDRCIPAASRGRADGQNYRAGSPRIPLWTAQRGRNGLSKQCFAAACGYCVGDQSVQQQRRQCSKLCKKTALPSNAARQFFQFVEKALFWVEM